MISKVAVLALCLFGVQADYHLPKSADEVSKVYIPHSTYGVPQEGPYPGPHAEYGVPTLKKIIKVEPIVSKYDYKIPEVKIVPAEVYGVPTRYAAPVETIVSKYEYNLPDKVKVAPYPHEVYGPPREVKLVVEEPVITHYEYKIPKTEIVEETPYPAPHKEYGVPVVPHTKYGVPE